MKKFNAYLRGIAATALLTLGGCATDSSAHDAYWRHQQEIGGSGPGGGFWANFDEALSHTPKLPAKFFNCK